MGYAILVIAVVLLIDFLLKNKQKQMKKLN